jgi:hypothetical protein
MALIRNAPPKPMRGEAMLERRQRRREVTTHEDKEMRAAKRRDKVCRYPLCEYRTQKLSLHACHLKHRGMGGNPKGDRTTRDTLITLCARHHGLFDAGQLDIQVMTDRGTDGPCGFYDLRQPAGKRYAGLS